MQNTLINKLTGYEEQLLKHISAGSTVLQIAKAVSISPFTVAFHVKNILRKKGCQDLKQLKGKLGAV